MATRGNHLGWTGSEVLVVGGTDGEQRGFGGDPPPAYTTGGAAFDPDEGTWRELPDAPVPAGWGATSAVTSGDRMLVVDDRGRWWQYDASDDAWSDVTDPPHPGLQPLLSELDGRVTWTTLPRRPRAHGIPTPSLVATADGVVVVGIRAPDAHPDDNIRADVYDGSRWARSDGPVPGVRGLRYWTGERLVMPMPDLDHRVGDGPTLALDVGTLTWHALPEGPYYESGGWGGVRR